MHGNLEGGSSLDMGNNTKSRGIRISAGICALATLLVVTLISGCINTSKVSSTPIVTSTPSPSLEPNLSKYDSELKMQISEALSSGNLSKTLPIIIRFYSELTDKEVSETEELGVTFHRLDGKLIHAGRIYTADANVSSILVLANLSNIEMVEYGKKKYAIPS